MNVKPLFPVLREEDIEVKVSSVTEDYVNLTLYKNGIIDSMMLDEAFGPLGWKKKNTVYPRTDGTEKLICTIYVKSDSGEWIEKDGVGTETNWEAEKGQETDAFKRAGFNWGIGRELKNHMPKLQFPASDCNVLTDKNDPDRRYCPDRFEVTQVVYDNEEDIRRRFVSIAIKNLSTGKLLAWDISKNLEEKREKLDNAREKIAAKKREKKENVCSPTLLPAPEPEETEAQKETEPEVKAQTVEPVKEKKKPEAKAAPVLLPTEPSKKDIEDSDPMQTTQSEQDEAKDEPEYTGDPLEYIVPLGGAKVKGKKIKELTPAQVRWLFTQPSAPSVIKDACIAFAKTDEKVRKEFVKNGISPDAA